MEATRLVQTNTTESGHRHFYDLALSPRASNESHGDAQFGCVIRIWDSARQDSMRAEIVGRGLDPSGSFMFSREKSPIRTNRTQWSSFVDQITNIDRHCSGWIHVAGWSLEALQELERLYLDRRPFFSLQDRNKQAFGGPVATSNGREYLWIQTPTWISDSSQSLWASPKPIDISLLMILSTEQQPGILVTSLQSDGAHLADADKMLLERLIYSNCLGEEALHAVWILAFAMMRIFAEQLEGMYDAICISKAVQKVRNWSFHREFI